MSLQNRLQDVARSAFEIYERRISAMARRSHFGPEPSPREIHQPPLVLVIGNHSSGKSSFINYLLGLQVQRTALAPMDDSFTLLTYGVEEQDVEGSAVVTNAELPFSGLSDFGPTLRSHLTMKRRPAEILKSVAIVDSPGMIDARLDLERGVRDRGYDFPAVVRWFAERADVILLFFDPDNPGTTGETLRILNESLRDLDHKLELIMNKVDRFENHHDFARCYGALCWNLARALRKLDLPHINLIYLPGHTTPVRHLPLEDFDRARDEVIALVRNAPARRVDNIVTRIFEFARALRVHARVLDCFRGEYDRARFKVAAALLLVLGLGGGYTAVLHSMNPTNPVPAIAAGATTALLFGAAIFLSLVVLRRHAEDLARRLNELFERSYRPELRRGSDSDDLRAIWSEQVRERLLAVVETNSPGSLPKLRRKELENLQAALELELPKLRQEIHKNEPRPGSESGSAGKAEAGAAGPSESSSEGPEAESGR